jgi:hypothetical protein
MADDKIKTRDRQYADKFGEWVTARLVKHINACYAMPEEVRTFLDRALQKKSGETQAEKAPYAVMGWLIMSIIDPDWPIPDSPPPEPDPE